MAHYLGPDMADAIELWPLERDATHLILSSCTTRQAKKVSTLVGCAWQALVHMASLVYFDETATCPCAPSASTVQRMRFMTSAASAAAIFHSHDFCGVSSPQCLEHGYPAAKRPKGHFSTAVLLLGQSGAAWLLEPGPKRVRLPLVHIDSTGVTSETGPGMGQGTCASRRGGRGHLPSAWQGRPSRPA